MHPDISEVLYTEEQLRDRVKEIGAALTEEYSDAAERGEGIVLLSVLRGAAIFMAVSSYGNGVKSSGEVKIVKDLSSNIRGKHVIVAEDILDSGLTLSYLLKNLQSRSPASIEVVTLLRKMTRQQAKINCKYVGFECPDQFIVGYGLDYAERYRNLPYIGILKPEVYR